MQGWRLAGHCRLRLGTLATRCGRRIIGACPITGGCRREPAAGGTCFENSGPFREVPTPVPHFLLRERQAVLRPGFKSVTIPKSAWPIGAWNPLRCFSMTTALQRAFWRVRAVATDAPFQDAADDPAWGRRISMCVVRRPSCRIGRERCSRLRPRTIGAPWRTSTIVIRPGSKLGWFAAMAWRRPKSFYKKPGCGSCPIGLREIFGIPARSCCASPQIWLQTAMRYNLTARATPARSTERRPLFTSRLRRLTSSWPSSWSSACQSPCVNLLW